MQGWFLAEHNPSASCAVRTGRRYNDNSYCCTLYTPAGPIVCVRGTTLAEWVGSGVVQGDSRSVAAAHLDNCHPMTVARGNAISYAYGSCTANVRRARRHRHTHTHTCDTLAAAAAAVTGLPPRKRVCGGPVLRVTIAHARWGGLNNKLRVTLLYFFFFSSLFL